MKVDESSPRVQSVPGSLVPLKPHQLAIVRAMCDVEDRIVSSVASDPVPCAMNSHVGSGKTFCVVAMSLLDRAMRRSLPPAAKGTSNATVVVVPSHLFFQWKGAVEQMAGSGLRLRCFNGYEDMVRFYDEKERDAFLHSFDVLLVSSLYSGAVAGALASSGVVVDEADNICERGKDDSMCEPRKLSCRVPANAVWYVSGTLGSAPEGVPPENVVECDPGFVARSFALPEIVLRPPLVCDDGGAYSALPFELLEDPPGRPAGTLRRALMACDAREVLKSCVGKFKGEKNEGAVAEALLSHWREEIEREAAMLAERDRELCEYEDEEGIRDRYLGRGEEWLESARSSVDRFDAVLFGLEPSGGAFSKLTALADICESAHARGEKTLVFNEFWGPLNDLANELVRRNVPYVDLDGGTAEKWAAAFERFNGGPHVHVLLAHSGMFSCGVNLEATSHLVLAHSLPDAMRTQIVGRAQRPGRRGPLAITELLYQTETHPRA